MFFQKIRDMDKRTFLKRTGGLLVAGVGAGFTGIQRMEAVTVATKANEAQPYPLYDLHVHRSQSQTLEQIVEKARDKGIEMFGVMENCGAWGVRSNEDLEKYINEVKGADCFIGLQPVVTGWSKNLDQRLLNQIDYVLMDPQFMPNSNKYGDMAQLWDHNCYIDDAEDFMERHVKFYLEIINNPEPLTILGWPLYLPPCLGRDYYRLWTRERMETIIDAARKRGIAIEINDLAHTPHAEFILMAKKAGLKFTFGSDTRDERTFRLDFCKQIADLCGLTRDDFYIPVKKPRR